MALEAILLQLGGAALSKIIAKRFGPDMAEIANVALEALGEAFGVEPKPEAIEKRIDEVRARPNGDVEAGNAVTWAEAKVSDRILAEAELWKQVNVQQEQAIELLKAQMEEGGLAGAWLWLWQYFLMFVWAWSLVLVHLVNAGARLLGGANPLPAPDLTILMTLTGAYLALHMGGHTVLELMRGGVFKKGEKS